MSVAVSDIVPFRPPGARQEATSFLGMVIFIASWAMMFAALFFAYGMVRARAESWPPTDLPTLPLLLPGLGTVALALSSGAFHFALHSVRSARIARVAPSLAASLVFGALFLFVQIVVWRQAYLGGLRPDSGPYGSVFFGLTWLHAAHVAVGLVALGWMAVRAWAGVYNAARHTVMRLWAMYWHMVGIVWGLLFVLVYLF